MKIRSVGDELFHLDGQTYMTKLIVAFHNSAKAHKNSRHHRRNLVNNIGGGGAIQPCHYSSSRKTQVLNVLSLHHPNNGLQNTSIFYFPPFESVAKQLLFLGWKKILYGHLPPLHPPSHTYAQHHECGHRPQSPPAQFLTRPCVRPRAVLPSNMTPVLL
jgi:hypothetical protein